jgi:two-component system sensor histidine kinase ChvG
MIAITLTRHGDEAVIQLDDDGPGVPPDSLEAIFNRFYSKRPKQEAFGQHSGLGLSIVRQIVEAHGGSIICDNRRNEAGDVAGARFSIRLPLQSAQ